MSIATLPRRRRSVPTTRPAVLTVRYATRSARGFTLLETLIAMAILVMALTALLGHQGVGIQMSDYSNKVTQATLLSQGKLLDVENRILGESIDVFDNCEEGDFRREGFQQFRWKACAYKLEVGEGAAEALTEKFVGLLTGMAGLGGGAAGSSSGNQGNAMSQNLEQAAGQMSMAAGMIPTFLQQLEDQIRKVRVEVTWKDMIGEREVVVERFITALGADPVGEPPPLDGEVIDAQNPADLLDNGIN